MENSVDRKRARDESADSSDSKRLREASIIFDILDNDDDECAADTDVGRDPAAGVLADVIKSLEEEIVAPATEEAGASGRSDLGYLLEASDDDLGLPPAGESPTTSPWGDGVDGFDRIWGFEDVVAASPCGGLEFGVETEFGDGVMFEGGLFDYGADGIFGSLDAEEFPWHTAV